MRGSFVRSWRLIGMTNLMLNMINNPEFSLAISAYLLDQFNYLKPLMSKPVSVKSDDEDGLEDYDEEDGDMEEEKSIDYQNNNKKFQTETNLEKVYNTEDTLAAIRFKRIGSLLDQATEIDEMEEESPPRKKAFNKDIAFFKETKAKYLG